MSNILTSHIKFSSNTGYLDKQKALEFILELEEIVWDILSGRQESLDKINETNEAGKGSIILKFRVNRTFPTDELTELLDRFDLSCLGYYENLEKDIIETIIM